ncbi:hypothetical protein TPHA_0I01510 [Tetrapisispora phaffii CBS 4417]|uniref:TOM70 n=1 Tax=Tetrapisispora phaffii (strain ATCC 24235 / CBS 4417 / NBRC 1672 / NRRL Y-8282 / UCD 70-5) TaxID=1071381 RepID=G8BXM9_TETPH|nr:hypothetical protein TPHA_0I01510 [Tetrapisispora phaffii CBS 4417]CCE64657.1 hypothetical protein TPHA_0I01510 [Tetrapisispora phaffii CBS 4417]
MSASDGSVGGFIARNKTAIIATVAAGSAALGAYYYYTQLQRQIDDSSSSKKKKKKHSKKKKSTSTDEKSNSKNETAKVIYPVASNGEPDLSGKDSFSDELKEKYAMALKDKGNDYFKKQDFENALKYYNYALTLKQDPVFYSNISACYVSLGQLEKVVESSTEALKLKHDYSKALLRRASAYESLANYVDAMVDLSVLSLNGDFNGASIEPMLERNLNKQAMQVLKEKIAENKPQLLPSNTSLASFFGVFKPEVSLNNFNENSESEKELLNGLTNLYSRTNDGYLVADESFQKAVKLLEKEYEENKENNDIKEKYAIALEYNGILKFLKNDPLDAHNDIQKAIFIFPRVNSYIYNSLILADKGETEESIKNFDAAINLDATNAATYYHRGQLYFLTQQYEKAGIDFDKAKELDESNILPYIQLACLAYKENKFNDCETLFSEARRKFPTAPEVPNFYADVLLERNEFDKALKQYDISKKLEEAVEGIHVGIAPMIGKATLLARNPIVENLLESTELFEEACKLDPRSEQAKIGLAQLKLQQEEVDEAIALFEEAAFLARNMDEKLQATTFAEASKVQKKVRSDPVINQKIQETLAAYQQQGLM